nr:metallophosphoesterase [uncultured Blautia sp.]
MIRFHTQVYKLTSSKVPQGEKLKAAFLTDLHGREFGAGNQTLLEEIRRQQPDLVLCAGDMIVRTLPESIPVAKELLLSLAKEFPVYMALGNHECRMKLQPETARIYTDYEKELEKSGIKILHNEKEEITIGEIPLTIYGLELPMEYYHKPDSPKLSSQQINALIGSSDPSRLNILLAHNPKYGKAYFSWNADLTVCGHYHGGILRLSRHHGLICPQYLLFPPFCCGDFEKEGKYVVVSAGLGEHTIPVRIHNPRELLIIEMEGSPLQSHV